MGKYNPSAAKGYEPDKILDEGWGVWKVVNTKDDAVSSSGNAMVIIEFICTEGPEMQDGRSPAGAEATIFLHTEYDGMKPRGVKMMQTKLVSFIEACGRNPKKSFDWDELVAEEVEIEAYSVPGEYKGDAKNDLTKFRPLEEEEIIDEEADEE